MEGFVARLRGLPWSTTPEDIVKFFDESEIAGGEKGVHLTFSREGRASGEAFVEFASEEDVEKSLDKHNQHMGSRYIEVFRSKKSEMEWVVKRSGADHSNMSEACVKLRGLPFGCSKEEIAQFFTGFEIVPNGIMLPEDRLGRSTGEAFVQFASQDIAEKALGKHKDRIGHRYIEIFKSSLAEAHAVTGRDRYRSSMGMGRPGPYDRSDRYGSPMGPGGGPMGMGYNRGRGGRNIKGFFDDEYDDYNDGFGYGGRGRGGMRGRFSGMMDDRRGNGPPGSQYVSKTGHSVHMRGLPFQAQEQDIFEFFSPIQPVRVNFEFGVNGRPTGEANVDFATHQEAMDAMKKHKSNMQHRYIELFLNSTPSARSSSEGGGYGGPDMDSGFGGGNMSNNMGNMGGGGMGGGGGYSNSGSGFGGGSSMGGYNNMGGGNMGGSSMGGSSMGGGGMGGGGMGGGGMGGGGMGGGGMGGGGMGGNYGNQGGQFSSSQSYGNSSMSGGYNMGGSNQSGGYGGQGMNSGYMGGGGGGYNSMGSSAMNSLANPNYTAF